MVFDAHMHVGDFPMFNVSLDGTGLVALMREHGIATGLVFHPDNELVRTTLVRQPGVYGLVWANPRMPGAVDETRRLLDEPGSRFRGVKLHPLLDGYHPDDPIVHPIVELLIERGLPALIHCGHPIFTLPWSIEELIRRYPAARIVLGHMGHGNIVYINAAIDVAARNPNVFLETSGMPMHSKIREAVERVPYIVSFASFLDETSSLADLILPDHSFLEGVTDALPESGSEKAVISVAGPVMKPLWDTRASGDVLLEVSRKLQTPLNLPWQTYSEMVQATLMPMGEEAWSTAQKQSGWWGELPAAVAAKPTPPGGGPGGPGGNDGKATPVKYVAATFNGDASEFPFHFLPYASAAMLDGSLAHLPWLQEMPDPLTSAMWSSWVEINPKTAEKLGIHLADMVEVTSTAGTVRVPAFINPALAPDIVAMPAGQGHSTFTRYASNRGANPIEILAPVMQSETGTVAWAATRVKVARVGDADGRFIMFSARGELRENPHEGERR